MGWGNKKLRADFDELIDIVRKQTIHLIELQKRVTVLETSAPVAEKTSKPPVRRRTPKNSSID